MGSILTSHNIDGDYLNPIPLPVVGHVTDTNPCQSGARPTKATADRLFHLQQKKEEKKPTTLII